jgi:hypothetical protein
MVAQGRIAGQLDVPPKHPRDDLGPACHAKFSVKSLEMRMNGVRGNFKRRGNCLLAIVVAKEQLCNLRFAVR